MTTMTLAEYARRVGKSRAAVTQWKKAGRLVMQGDQVNVEASDAWLKRYRREGMPAIADSDPAVKRGRPSVKQNGKSVKQDDDLTHSLNTEPAELTCDEIEAVLGRLDWCQSFDWSEDAQRERARQAARCVGFVAIESVVRDDGHWGGFQLREEAAAADDMPEDSIIGGYGFELSAAEVVKLCRDQVLVSLWPGTDARMFEDDRATVVPALLPALAYPFYESEKAQ
ncbi:hypothetical protein ACQUFY_16770 [Robbsia andropogonis]|uniref:hypothetical protein n=1 Tax=Robbsia andropogonis TaxID=28092 RepID=UPI003D2219F5